VVQKSIGTLFIGITGLVKSPDLAYCTCVAIEVLGAHIEMAGGSAAAPIIILSAQHSTFLGELENDASSALTFLQSKCHNGGDEGQNHFRAHLDNVLP